MGSPSIRLGAVGVLAALLGLGVAGCGDALDDLTEGFDCNDSVKAKAQALGVAASGLVDAAAELRAEIGGACAAIANDLGKDGVPTIDASSTDDDVKTACELAKAALDAEISGGVTVEVAIEGGRCEVNAQAQFSCEASCDIEGECTPGDVSVRCDPGELSVQCEGQCKAEAYCQGSVEAKAECEGSCEATCSGTCDGEIVGTCDGTCMGTCDGECDGSADGGTCNGTCNGTCQGMCTGMVEASCGGECKGTCTGSCQLSADASIDCGADVRCKGGCEGTATAPSCEGDITPPSCNLDADCRAGCEGQAKLEATCTRPSIDVRIVGDVDAKLETTLETNLPALIDGARLKGKLALAAAKDVGTAAKATGQAIANQAACVVSVGESVVADLQAAAQASASVSVSVSASVSVSGSVGVQ